MVIIIQISRVLQLFFLKNRVLQLIKVNFWFEEIYLMTAESYKRENKKWKEKKMDVLMSPSQLINKLTCTLILTNILFIISSQNFTAFIAF